MAERSEGLGVLGLELYVFVSVRLKAVENAFTGLIDSGFSTFSPMDAAKFG